LECGGLPPLCHGVTLFLIIGVSRHNKATAGRRTPKADRIHREQEMDYLQAMLLSSLVLALTLLTPVSGAKTNRLASCLPEGVKLTSEILEASDGSTSAKGKPKTVASKLAVLRARCKNRTLLTRNGKEIRIVQLIGCWGNPPADYEEQLQHQERELKALREKYIVIEIPCSPNRIIASVASGNRSNTSYRPYTTEH